MFPGMSHQNSWKSSAESFGTKICRRALTEWIACLSLECTFYLNACKRTPPAHTQLTRGSKYTRHPTRCNTPDNPFPSTACRRCVRTGSSAGTGINKAVYFWVGVSLQQRSDPGSALLFVGAGALVVSAAPPLFSSHTVEPHWEQKVSCLLRPALLDCAPVRGAAWMYETGTR